MSYYYGQLCQIIFMISQPYLCCQSFDLDDVPDTLFRLGINVVAGLPFEVVLSAVNVVCSAAISSGTIRSRITPDLNKMNFQLRTACNKYEYPLLSSSELWNNPEFDRNKSVVIYASGFMSTITNSSSIDELSKVYNCRDDVNFVAVDAANFVDTLYTWSALNTDEIGKNIAVGLVELTKIVPVENIHLIGHSLGAHIMGAAGRNFYYQTGKLIPRITALDPAKPCFNEGQSLSGLMRGDAEFIDVIHSDPGALGKREPTGDIDFYPGGLGPLPKGCYDIGCAHARSWQYYAETVYQGNEMSYLGVRCTSLIQAEEGKCPGPKVPMGYAVPKYLKGNYFLDVNGEEPFGKQSDAGFLESKKNCGTCQN
ncbi:vitellogenin-3-like isoform X2 [Eurosta solidaginis]|uniref:vitellogenin-3-like isoform X2 n=1 Tax=Eurosta solidaginis TaxID=178769 RepID=UPI0035313940